MKNRAGTRMGRGFVGQIVNLRPIVNRPNRGIRSAPAAVSRGTLWVARRLPTCPTSVGHVVLNTRVVFRPCHLLAEARLVDRVEKPHLVMPERPLEVVH